MTFDDPRPRLSAAALPRLRLALHPWRGALHALGSRLAFGRLSVETPDGEAFQFSGQGDGPSAALTIHRWRALRRIMLGGDIGFADAYVAGDWSSPDPTRLIDLALANEASFGVLSWGMLPLRLANRLRHLQRRNTRRGSRRNIAEHYDLGNAFYAQWLDPGMTYSSGLFATGRETLEEAQTAKNDRVLAWLDIDAESRIIEIGCGWGGLAEALIRRWGCHVTALTLSREQHAYATDRLAAAGLGRHAEIRLEDYRDATGEFDGVVSIEMLEAVGEANWPRYFNTLRERLVSGGVAVLQVITISDERFEHYRQGADFIQRRIFPGGMLPSPAAIRQQVARAGLILDRVECFGLSYARTLAEWRARFLRAWPELTASGLPPRFGRMWEYYLAYCEAGFRAGIIDVGLYRVLKPR